METSTAPTPEAPPTPVRGRFVWYDLMTPDPAGAQAFYTHVAGWTTQGWQPPAGAAPADAAPGAEAPPYTMWVAGEAPLGGVTNPGEHDGAAYWLAYVGVADVDAAVAEVTAAGGSVLTPPEGIPGVGRFAICRDPQGAVFAPFQPDPPDMPAPEAPPAGGISWHELTTSDLDAAWAFYRRVFGWRDAGAHDMGPEMGPYQLFDADAGPGGGMFRAPAGMPLPTAWKLYVHTPDVDGAVARVREAGGTVLMEPHEVPGGDRIAVCADPQGAEFGLHEPAAR